MVLSEVNQRQHWKREYEKKMRYLTESQRVICEEDQNEQKLCIDSSQALQLWRRDDPTSYAKAASLNFWLQLMYLQKRHNYLIEQKLISLIQKTCLKTSKKTGKTVMQLIVMTKTEIEKYGEEYFK
ncbi:hypothetical protein QYF36_024573 [Acer negundo]|nr:hypothetical protein QYF36_024573 [Acer negundo]